MPLGFFLTATLGKVLVIYRLKIHLKKAPELSKEWGEVHYAEINAVSGLLYGSI